MIMELGRAAVSAVQIQISRHDLVKHGIARNGAVHVVILSRKCCNSVLFVSCVLCPAVSFGLKASKSLLVKFSEM